MLKNGVAVAKYHCSIPGYVIHGNDEKICTKNGTWVGEISSCGEWSFYGTSIAIVVRMKQFNK